MKKKEEEKLNQNRIKYMNMVRNNTQPQFEYYNYYKNGQGSGWQEDG